jgi:hypothetical protein
MGAGSFQVQLKATSKFVSKTIKFSILSLFPLNNSNFNFCYRKISISTVSTKLTFLFFAFCLFYNFHHPSFFHNFFSTVQRTIGDKILWSSFFRHFKKKLCKPSINVKSKICYLPPFKNLELSPSLLRDVHEANCLVETFSSFPPWNFSFSAPFFDI